MRSVRVKKNTRIIAANNYQSVILRMQAPVYSHEHCATSGEKNQQEIVEVGYENTYTERFFLQRRWQNLWAPDIMVALARPKEQAE